MTQDFPYPERPEEPESDQTLASSTGSAPDAQPPSEPDEEASQTLNSGASLDFGSESPLSSEPEESADPTLHSDRPAEPTSEPSEWTPTGVTPAVGAPPEGTEENVTVDASVPSEPAPQPTPVGSAQAIASASAGAKPAVVPLSPDEERTWSMVSHLTMLLNLVTGFLGPVAALIIYLYYKDRSRLVAFHAMQSFVFQIVTWIGGGLLIGAIWVITGLLSAILIGLLCIPFAALLTIPLAALPVIGLVYSVIGAIQVNSGQPFSYWLVGDWVRGMID